MLTYLFSFMKLAQNYSLITRIGGIAISLVLPLVTPESAQAIMFVENLSEPTGSAIVLDNLISLGGSSFTTDGNNYSLNSVTARLFEITEDNFSFNLYTDDGGLPGIVIGELNTTADIVNAAFNDYLFTPNSSINLDANTTYWIIGSITGSGLYAWGVTGSFNQTGPGAWTIGDANVTSINGGSSWQTDGLSTTQFSIDADIASGAVPFEFSPSMGIFFMSGLFTAKAAYRKYQSSKVKFEN